MRETSIQTFVDAAPVEMRSRLAELADPTLRGHLRKVSAKPSTIKRSKSKEAQWIVSYISDPKTLAGIYKSDRRVGVEEAVRQNPFWQEVAHSDLCTQCSKPPRSVSAENLRTAIADGSITCPNLVIRRLLNSSDAELWEDAAVQELLKGSAALRVADAAGRVPKGINYVSGSTLRTASTRVAELLQLIAEEKEATASLLELVMNTTKRVPRHWRPTSEQWEQVLGTCKARTVISAVNGPDAQTLITLWEKIPVEDRPWVLEKADTEKEVRAITQLLSCDPNLGMQDRGPTCYSLLTQRDDLDDKTRVLVAKALGAHAVTEYLIGKAGLSPRSNEVRELVNHLTVFEQGGRIAALARAVNRAASTSSMRHHPALFEALLDVAPAGVVLSVPGPLADAGHRRLWQALDQERHAETVAVLLREWDETIGELIEAVTRL